MPTKKPSLRGPVLYHYTSADAFLGIVGSRMLWATDIRFLNDSAEFSLARDTLVGHLRMRARRLRHNRVEVAVSQALDHMASTKVPAYVICFSERGNSLSQWRAYAPRDGLSVGFHRGALEAVKGFSLQKCVYLRESAATADERRELQQILKDVEQSVAWVSRLIQQDSRRKHPAARDGSASEEDRTLILSHGMIWAALRIKHAGFSEEREWRLIDNRNPMDLVQGGAEIVDHTLFRRGAFGITPYIVATLPEEWRTLPLGIAEVIVGPSPNAAAVVESVKDLLWSKLRSKAPVTSCDIPYRAW
jgi:Protein of unknown function (DUF2971)